MQPERARVIACEVICFYNNAKTIVNNSLTVNVQAYCSRLEVDTLWVTVYRCEPKFLRLSENQIMSVCLILQLGNKIQSQKSLSAQDFGNAKNQ